jgi:hypothetical protein
MCGGLIGISAGVCEWRTRARVRFQRSALRGKVKTITITFAIRDFIFISAASLCCMIAGGFFWKMIGEVNRKLPDDKQIEYFFMYPGKWSRVTKKYKLLYPDGRLHYVCMALGVIGMVFMLMLAWDQGFFR